jgi:hypothetical protein
MNIAVSLDFEFNIGCTILIVLKEVCFDAGAHCFGVDGPLNKLFFHIQSQRNDAGQLNNYQ